MAEIMSDISYRLELLVDEGAKEYYAPIKERPNDNAGFDLFLSKTVQTKTSEVSLCPLGCRARMIRCYPDEMEEEVHYWLAPRSSIWKSGVIMVNSMGIIDRTYRGPLMGAVLPIYKMDGHWSVMHEDSDYDMLVRSCKDKPVLEPSLEKGIRLFQILAPDMGWIKEVRLVDSLPETSRGEGGFGSTGK
jgi:dUTPase